MTISQYAKTAEKLVPDFIAGRDRMVNNIAVALDDVAKGRSIEAIKEGKRHDRKVGPALMSITLFDVVALYCWMSAIEPSDAFKMAERFVIDRDEFLSGKHEVQESQETANLPERI